MGVEAHADRVRIRLEIDEQMAPTAKALEDDRIATELLEQLKADE
jgi:hypothetical protein